MILLLAGLGFGGAAAFQSSCTFPDPHLKPIATGQNTFVYAANGSLLGSIASNNNRQPVRYWNMSPWLKKASVAIEDRRFWHHGGLDYVGIARAAWKDVLAGKVVQGGSTIEQQLVRNVYTGRERTFSRKIKEACLAMKMSQHWSKRKILEDYLNTVYYGNHSYGVQAAAETYFSRPAKWVTLPEAALLAGLPQAPSSYDPFVDRGDARQRRNEVLTAMLQNGDINRRRYRAAIRTSLGLHPGGLYTHIREPYFFSYVRHQLVHRYGERRVRSGGLRVYTTVEPRYQADAIKAIRDVLYYRTDPAAAVVAIDPSSGAIRAMTGVTPGKKKSEFNLVAQARRQAGSTFKMFVLATAISQGINPATSTFVSAPFTYQPNSYSPAWDVTTYDHTYAGTITVEQATLLSDNTVYAQLSLQVGPENVARMAHWMGVRTHLPPVPSLGLGSIAVSPLEMASAYATLAAGGIYSRPMAIRMVKFPSGRVDRSWSRVRRHRVISSGTAYEVTRILQENMTSGTGVGAYFGRPSAGKTGTTSNYADAWFDGFTPDLVGVVWVGYPGGEVPMYDVHGIAVSGPTFPATIWKLFMESALGNTPPVSFPLPSSYPIWKPFVRGPFAITAPPPPAPSPTPAPQPSPTTTTTTTTQAQTTTQAPPPPPPPPPPPTTTTTTTPPPPPPPPGR